MESSNAPSNHRKNVRSQTGRKLLGHMPKKALITGITGQDGSYLAELLLEKGYEVHGMVRRVAIEDPRAPALAYQPHSGQAEAPFRVTGKLPERLSASWPKCQPDEVYHLAAQSFVSYSFEDEFSRSTRTSTALTTCCRRSGSSAPDALLLRRLQRDVRRIREKSAEREHAISPPLGLRNLQGRGLRSHPQLPRGVRAARVQRHTVQP